MSALRIARSTRKALALLTPALLVATALALASCTGSASYHAHDITGMLPDLEFELTNENGKRVDETDYANARLTLMYFGYTYCPDVCPTTLSHISSALARLDESVRHNINVLFVSVDPKRDTPERLKTYTAYFGPQFIGLTGTQEQLRSLTKAMRITYSYGEPNKNGFYTVSHSSAIFVFDDEGDVRLLVGQDETVDELTADLKTLLAQTA